MEANRASPTREVPPVPGSGTHWGVVHVRKAVDRLRALAAVALAISVLVLLLEALHAAGLLNMTPVAELRSAADWSTFGLQIGTLLAVGVTLLVLFIAGVVFAITGVLAWRRGVLAVERSAFESGPAQVEAARRARQDHSLTLWMVVVFVAAGMALSIGFGAVNALLGGLGQAELPGALTTIASALAGSIVLVFAYHFGSRSLVELLYGLASPASRARLLRGRNLLLLGAWVGLLSAGGAISWLFGAAAAASLALVLAGASELLAAYDEWLSGRRTIPTAVGGRFPASA